MEKAESETMTSPQQAKRTLRLIFEYEGNTVRLVSQQRVSMIPPPSTSILDPQEGQTGFWYELRDNQDLSVYSRVVANPIPLECEVFSDDPNESIRRQEIEVAQGTFVLLAPDIPEAASVVLFSPPLQLTERAGGTTELARFDLTRGGNE